jgi:lysophospholipase L1-like esterase
VACVGDSITAGYALAHPEKDAYPVQLGRMLGAQWEVRNFGVSGATMMMDGNYPYMKRPQYREALEYKPDVVIIALGTNDSKAVNIDAHPQSFRQSYEQMIAEFRKANPHVRIFVCLPPPAFADVMTIREAPIVNAIIPQIREIARKHRSTIIDLHSGTADAKAMFPDSIHPNPDAAGLLAREVMKVLTPQGSRGMSLSSAH